MASSIPSEKDLEKIWRIGLWRQFKKKYKNDKNAYKAKDDLK